jgi:hypothetical protein
VERRAIAVTGAVWLDPRGDGRRLCVADHARRLVERHAGRTNDLIANLGEFDEAVALQAATLLRQQGVAVNDSAVLEAARTAGPHVVASFEAYAEAWRQSQIARNK